MGLDLKWADPGGEALAYLYDPKHLLGWLERVVGVEGTMCLSSIDPYDDTVLSEAQVRALVHELEAALPRVTHDRLEEVRRDRVAELLRMPSRRSEVTASTRYGPSIEELRGHFERLLELARLCSQRPGTYLKFIGD